MDKKIYLILFLVFTIFQSVIAQNDSSYVRTERKKNETQRETDSPPFKEKFFVGVYPGFGISNNYFAVEVSPLVGIELVPKLSVGAGLVYKYSKGELLVKDRSTQAIYVDKYEATNLGLRVFGYFDVYRNFNVYAEYEGVSANYDYKLSEDEKQWEPAFKGGLLYRSVINNKFSASFLALYNFLYEEGKSSSQTPLDIRFGIIYYPFRSNY
jgi:hypothetical protein